MILMRKNIYIKVIVTHYWEQIIKTSLENAKVIAKSSFDKIPDGFLFNIPDKIIIDKYHPIVKHVIKHFWW